jgi:hypothetical protein
MSFISLFQDQATIVPYPRCRGCFPHHLDGKAAPCYRRTLLSVIQSKPGSFFGHSVRHLYLREVPNEAFLPILSACTGVENLWIRDIRMNWMSSITSLTLKHFYGRLKPILKTISPSHLFFSQLTHIEVLGMAFLPSLDDMRIWSTLRLILGLTHLSFNDEDCIPICSRLLETCKLLPVLIVLNGRVKLRTNHMLQF